MASTPVEESPGSMETRWRLTAAGGDPRDSATESKPPRRGNPTAVRVKGCGKSAPRGWQQSWHGKPHREQDQIGAAGSVRQRMASSPSSGPPPGLVARGAEQSASQMNGRRGRQLPDRTRLTGRLIVFLCRIRLPFVDAEHRSAMTSRPPRADRRYAPARCADRRYAPARARVAPWRAAYVTRPNSSGWRVGSGIGGAVGAASVCR